MLPKMMGLEGFVGSRGGTARQEIEKAAAIRKTKVEISEVLPVQNKSVAFKVRVEEFQRLLTGYSAGRLRMERLVRVSLER